MTTDGRSSAVPASRRTDASTNAPVNDVTASPAVTSDDAFRTEPVDTGRAVSQPLAVHERVVLANSRRGAHVGGTRAREGDWHPHADDIRHPAEPRMLEPDSLAARQHAGIAHALGRGPHCRARHTVTLEYGQQRRRRLHASKRLDLGVECVYVRDP